MPCDAPVITATFCSIPIVDLPFDPLLILHELNCTCLSYLAFLFSVLIRTLAVGPDEAGF